MKVNELWLKERVPYTESTQDIADRLTDVGLEVEDLNRESASDPIFCLKIPPNRGDCLGVEGLAREISALTKTALQPLNILNPFVHSEIAVQITEPESCWRYAACVVNPIRQGVSTPQWIVDRLTTAGIRCVHVVVDITNYVMLELGQPLHAFDYTKLQLPIVVRQAKPKEFIELLDGKTVTLPEKALVIADQKKAHAIAGIMGGLESSVTESTQSVLIESACFNPSTVRLISAQLGLKTESAYRFERGVDFNLSQRALNRAVTLIQEIVGGEVIACTDVIAKPEKIIPIQLSRAKIIQYLGFEIPDEKVMDILSRLQMKVAVTKTGFDITPPSYRQDLQLSVDIIEEIVRMIGLQSIPSQPLSGIVKLPEIAENRLSVQEYREVLVNRGYHECVNYSFIDPKWDLLFPSQSGSLKLSNPITSELANMRLSLIPGLLQTVHYHQCRQMSDLRFFECGKCYLPGEETVEQWKIAGVCSGLWGGEQWGYEKRSIDFFDVKGDVEALLSFRLSSPVRFKSIQREGFHPGQTAEILFENQSMGVIGSIHPQVLASLEISGPVIGFEIALKPLEQGLIPRCEGVAKYPSIRRDIAILVNKAVSAEAILTAIHSIQEPLLQKIWIFDIYEGKPLEKDQKSVAIGLIFQDISKTLRDEAINPIMDRVVTGLKQTCQAVLRG